MKEINRFVKMMGDITKTQNELVNSSLFRTLSPILNNMPKVDYIKSVIPNAAFLYSTIPPSQLKHFSPELALISQTYKHKNFENFISPYMQVISTVIPSVQMASVFAEVTGFSKALAFNQINTIAPAIISMSNILPFIQAQPIFPEIATISNLIKKSKATILTYNDLISTSIVSKISQLNDDEILITIDEIDSNCAKVKKDKLSLDFFINLFITLSLFMYDRQSSNNDKKEFKYSIKESETKIISEVKKITDFQIPGQYYVVIRQNYAYDYPSTNKSKIITVLYPNQKIRIIKKHGEWLHIEYFNYLKNQHEQAWCKKKYSKLIKM